MYWNSTNIAAVVCIVLIMLIYIYCSNREPYIVNREQANKIIEWSKKNPSMEMTSFKNIIQDEPNMDLLDLNRARKLNQAGQLTADRLVE